MIWPLEMDTEANSNMNISDSDLADLGLIISNHAFLQIQISYTAGASGCYISAIAYRYIPFRDLCYWI